MTQAFNLSQFANNVDTTGKAILTSGQSVTGILPVANGGTGVATIPSNRVMLGSGTSGVSTVGTTTSGGGAVSAGMLLTYQGSSSNPTWESAPITGQNVVVYNATGTWTVPAGVTKAIIELWGGGGGGGKYPYSPYGAYYSGAGGYIKVYVTGLSGSYAISIGAGGTITSSTFGNNGGNTLFGSSLIVANGGGGASGGSGADGSSSSSIGTILRQSNARIVQGSLGGLNNYADTPAGTGYNTVVTWSQTTSACPGAYGYCPGGNNAGNNPGMSGACVITY